MWETLIFSADPLEDILGETGMGTKGSDADVEFDELVSSVSSWDSC